MLGTRTRFLLLRTSRGNSAGLTCLLKSSTLSIGHNRGRKERKGQRVHTGKTKQIGKKRKKREAKACTMNVENNY